MSERKKQHEASEGRTRPRRPVQPKRAQQPEVGTRRGEEARHEPPVSPARVGHEAERLTPEEKKRLFARNLDRLLRLAGLSRKAAAEEIGVDYKVLRRFVSEGVGKIVRPNQAILTRIAAYFVLPGVEDLWRTDLLARLLCSEEGQGFVEKFRPRLMAERERRLAEEGSSSHDELALLSRALGFERAAPPLTGPWADKVAAILASPKAEHFKRLIDDYHQFALASGSAKGRKPGQS
jgi:hypothetical protein